jgi:hypothetical protein
MQLVKRTDIVVYGSPTVLRQRALLVIVIFLRTAHETITVSGIPNYLNYCDIFVVCILFTNLAADRVFETHILAP